MSELPTDAASSAGDKFQRLVELMARLRAPGGCPWDREQTFDTIKPYLLEETYEVMDAIDARDWRELEGELGDLLLQSVFFAQMAKEAGHFSIGDSIDSINAKLVRRHPHVFGDASAADESDVRRIWAEVKKEEKKDAPPAAMLDSISRRTPALVEAREISSRAAQSGFDWPSVDGVIEKLHEELREIESASTDEVEGEIGDLLFVVVNLARFKKVDPEQALRKTNAKFRARFSFVEEGLAAQGKTPKDATLEEMEGLWQKAKSISGR